MMGKQRVNVVGAVLSMFDIRGPTGVMENQMSTRLRGCEASSVEGRGGEGKEGDDDWSKVVSQRRVKANGLFGSIVKYDIFFVNDILNVHVVADEVRVMIVTSTLIELDSKTQQTGETTDREAY